MKNILKASLYLLMTSLPLFAQNYKLPLWEKNTPNKNDIVVVEKSETSDALRISEVDEPTIEVFLPSKKFRNGAAVVICPGGGYRILAYDKEGTDIAKLFNSKGISAVVLKYRLPHSANNIEGRLSPFLDAQRALRLTRYHAKEWDIDPNKIGIMGFSAGGHLASTLGTHYDEDIFNTDKIDSVECRPDFMILMYPVITFIEPYTHSGSRKTLLGESKSSELDKYYSNELHITNDTPPTFLVHATDDSSVPVKNSLMFYEGLKTNGVPVEMHIFSEGGHGFGLALGKGKLEQWKDLCVSWIKSLN